MKFIISELFSAVSVNLVELVRTLVIGAICITAIVECGIFAFIMMSAVTLLKYLLDYEAENGI